jgi:hypothetical protein
MRWSFLWGPFWGCSRQRQQWGGLFFLVHSIINFLSNAGYVGMFETRLSVCMCSSVLFGVRSEAVARQRSTIRWCFLFGPFRGCYRMGRMSAVISFQKDPTNCEGMKWVPGAVFSGVKRSRREAKIQRIFLSIQCPWRLEGQKVVFSFLSVPRLITETHRVVASVTWLASRCPGNVFTVPLPLERVYRSVAPGTC